jgi:predicted flap endonuclease-1-like 5' DNA nuclease
LAKLEDIEGIGAVYAEKLRGVEVHTQQDLLEAGAKPAGRHTLEEDTGISHVLLLKWINRADLARVKGIGEEYADLLEAGGVDSVPELAQRNPANLHTHLVEVNEAKKLVRQVPSQTMIEGWVTAAKALPRAVEY